MSPALSVHFLQTQSDSRLLALARNGHERAFEALVHRYRKQLLAYCRRLLLPESRAEDALQQALMQAWIALERGDEVRDARAWLYRIAHNTAVNSLRGSGYDYAELNESLAGDDAPEEDLDRRIAVRAALAGLAALPPLQREALLRTAVEGRPHDEVAAALGLSDGALRGLVYRARATLRSAATAVTPPSLVAWVASAGAHPGSLSQRLPELAASGGSAGVAAVLLKGGTVAVTAGALVVGAAAVHVHHGAAHRSISHQRRTVRATPEPADAVAAPRLVEADAAAPVRRVSDGGALRIPPTRKRGFAGQRGGEDRRDSRTTAGDRRRTGDNVPLRGSYQRPSGDRLSNDTGAQRPGSGEAEHGSGSTPTGSDGGAGPSSGPAPATSGGDGGVSSDTHLPAANGSPGTPTLGE